MAIDLRDRSPYGNHLTNTGATEAVFTAFPQSTVAVNFASASSQFLSAVDSLSLRPISPFTVEFWIRPTSAAAFGVIFQSYSENVNQAGINIGLTTSNTIQFISGRNTGTTADTDFKNLTSTGTVPNLVKSHVACVYDGTFMRIYLNGFLDSTTAWANNPGYAATNYVRIGCRNVAGTEDSFLDGGLDEVRFWNIARTSTEIRDNRFNELIGNERGLIGYWPFDISKSILTFLRKVSRTGVFFVTSTSTSTSTTSTSSSTTTSTSSSSSTSTSITTSTSSSTTTSTSTTSTSSSTSTSTSTSSSTSTSTTSTSSSTSTTSTSTTTTWPYKIAVDGSDSGAVNEMKMLVDLGYR